MTKEELKKLQDFQAILNREPNPDEVQVNKAANNTKYLPISFLEMTLDELFFGLWSLTDFQYTVIGNEVTGKITLSYIHPVNGAEIKRTGAAATMIRCKQGQPFDANGKIANALEMDIPHLKADCVRNACASLGKLFGRDLNRQHKDDFKGILPKDTTPTNELPEQTQLQQIAVQLEEVNSPAELDTLFNSLKMAGVKVTPDIVNLFSSKKASLVNG